MWFLYLLLIFVFSLSFIFYNKGCVALYKCVSTREEKGSFCVKRKNFYLFLSFVFFVFFSSLRYPRMGTDTYSYLVIFNEINQSDAFPPFSFTEEYGYYILNKLVGYLCQNYQFFLFVVNSFVLLSILHFISKQSKCIWFSLLLFVLMGYLDSTMSLVRFSIALSLSLYSYKYVLDKRFIPFLLVVVIASFFHMTSWVLLCLYFTPFLKDKVLHKKYFFLYLLSIFAVFFSAKFLMGAVFDNISFYAYYENDETFGVQESAKLAPALDFLVNVCVIIYVRSLMIKKRKADDKTLMYFNTLLIASYFLALSIVFTPIGRIAKYFSLISIILIPNVTYDLVCVRKRFVLTALILAAFLLRYVIIAVYRPEWAAIYPYKFFFEN